MSAFVTQATMAMEDFWMEVNVLLNCVDQTDAAWTEELLEPYCAGMSVGDAFRRVLAGRVCRG